MVSSEMSDKRNRENKKVGVTGRRIICFRYWSHVENCSSCKKAHRYLNALEVILQIGSVALIGVMAVAKQITLSNAARIVVVVAAVLSFAASKWLSHFIYKTFRYHDYNHALI